MEIETALTAIRPPREQSRRVDIVIARIAGRQHGVISLSQLVAAGLTARAVSNRVATGRLHRVHKGIFAVGHASLTREGRWVAAVLWGGFGSALSHQAAGAHHGLRAWYGRPTITVPRQRRSNSLVEAHHGVIAPDEMEIIDGIRTTTVARTIFDLASALDRKGLEDVIREAEIRQLSDAVPVASLLERHPGRRGIANLRSILADLEIGAGVTASELEDLFEQFLLESCLPTPRFNAPVKLNDRFIVADCLWPEHRLIVELDGFAVHSRRLQRDADTQRDRELLLAGWRVIRVTWRHLHAGRSKLKADLGRLLRSKLR